MQKCNVLVVFLLNKKCEHKFMGNEHQYPSIEFKVCLVSPLPPPHGGIAHWTELIHRFARISGKVTFIQVDTAPRWRAINDIMLVKRIPGGALQFIRDYILFLVALQKKPNLIHLTTSGSLAAFRDLAMCITARLWRIPLVYHIRFGRVPEIAAANTFEWRMLAKVMQLTHVVMAITPDTAETIRQYLPDTHVEYTPNPIDLSELPTLIVEEEQDRNIALFLGWVIPTKGVEELVQAWAELAPPGWELLLVGPGEVAYQTDLLLRYNPRNLRFVGELTHIDAMQILAKSDLFVLPSYTEGFPNVVLEAMALGKPIIATTVGAINEMLSDGCGLLINPRDVEGLLGSLSRLTQDKELRYELGTKGYKKVRQSYSVEVIFARYFQIWQSLIQKEF